ncbi:glycosyltransferase [Flavobacterium sp.]|uniref:glycosyltransferase family 2 protein n=1 Tax=Flavobacterium sp. TaxID=239 RepID=UPI0024899519|nr:glycosyltransferase [Flavobacterium sp.]MDI1318517.1 glycosyltransferase [Flavobacterium sp.]
MKESLKVSICMITYGHENFIEEAINGVLMQECDFEIELIISNDCSPDKTDAVIQKILKTHPKASTINYINQENNLGIAANFIFTLEQCNGKYIAICEGDDYWIDPLKLQKQVDFLETNEDYLIHSGNAILLSSDLSRETLIKDNVDSTFVLEDFLSNNNLITCTVMFRNQKFHIPEIFNKITFLDWFLYVILMKNGRLKAYRSVEIYSIYRVQNSGVMINLSELNSCNTHIFQIISIHNYLGINKIKGKAREKLNYYFNTRYNLVLKEKKYVETLKIVCTNFQYCKFKTPLRKYLSDLKLHFFVN